MVTCLVSIDREMNDICQKPAVTQLVLLKSGEISATELLEAHFNVIESCNPKLNALVTLNKEAAMERARQLDNLPANSEKGQLHGLTYVVKDTIETKGLKTTYGSPVFKDHVPGQSAVHVNRAERAGAIIIGKTNTPEFACGGQTCNPLFGVTRNPFDLEKTVTGSSGGAAAAIASGMSALADGSDLGGSLRSPASTCHIYGFRPTAGQIPRAGNPLSFDSLHVYGPMARSVEDIALMMSVFSGPHNSCPLSLNALQLRYSNFFDEKTEGVKIAWSTHPCNANTHPEVAEIMNSVAPLFQQAGFIVENQFPDIGENAQAHQVIFAVNALTELSSFLEHPDFDPSPRLRMFLEKGQATSGKQLAEARKIQTRSWQTISEFFNRFDFMVWPSMCGLPFSAELGEDEIQEDWSVVEMTPSLNLPSIAVPGGMSRSGLPVGLQILGPPGSDLRLLKLAHQLSQLQTK